MPAKIDITGQRFGKLVAIEPITKRKNGRIVWKCECDCGGTTATSAGTLRLGIAQSCGCSRYPEMVDLRFGRLTVISKETISKFSRGITWKCLCDCGNICFATGAHLRAEEKKSCGCLWEAYNFIRGTNIDPADVPIEISRIVKTRREVKKAIKQAN